MTKIDIFSGFLGAGKTTLIKKLIEESFQGEKLVLIENEFGEIGIDGGFLKDAGINVTEMNSGCICCSLVGDFGTALKKVMDEFTPDRILIEPSGVGKLSDVIKAVKGLGEEKLLLNSYTAIVDAKRAKMYAKNFGEFFLDQISHAKCIVLSHTGDLSDEKIADCIALLRQHNTETVIVSTDWNALTGEQILSAMEGVSAMDKTLHALEEESLCPTCGHHHVHNCCHDHHDHDHCHDHCHDDSHEHCHEHEHEHAHETCHEHEHHDHAHHHAHHHADDVFQSFGVETAKRFSADALTAILSKLEDESTYGTVLRAKGIVECTDGDWLHFDYVPGVPDVRSGTADVIGRICVIGSALNNDAIRTLFGLNA